MSTKKKSVKKAVTKKKAVAKKKVAVKKKVSVKKSTAKKRVVKKKSVASQRTTHPQVSPRERYEMVATMAYYRAEKRNFESGHDYEDWLECEAIVDKMLAK